MVSILLDIYVCIIYSKCKIVHVYVFCIFIAVSVSVRHVCLCLCLLCVFFVSFASFLYVSVLCKSVYVLV